MNRTEIINAQRYRALTRRQKQLLRDVVDAVLDYEHVSFPCEVAITLVGGSRIRQLNREFRQIDAETDVLSFPSGEYPPEREATADEPCYLGDMALNIHRAEEQSMAYGHSFERELAFLTAHSMLHLLGYDHMKEDEEVVMFARQEDILNKMGITR